MSITIFLFIILNQNCVDNEKPINYLNYFKGVETSPMSLFKVSAHFKSIMIKF